MLRLISRRMVLGLIPLTVTLVAWYAGAPPRPAGPFAWQFWLAVLLSIPGLILAFWSMSLFFQFGDGTPAPWDPPEGA